MVRNQRCTYYAWKGPAILKAGVWLIPGISKLDVYSFNFNPDSCSQIVEIRPEEERFLRLLEILGEWYEKGKLIIFVGSQVCCTFLGPF